MRREIFLALFLPKFTQLLSLRFYVSGGAIGTTVRASFVCLVAANALFLCVSFACMGTVYLFPPRIDRSDTHT